jgi:hypothetical protein
MNDLHLYLFDFLDGLEHLVLRLRRLKSDTVAFLSSLSSPFASNKTVGFFCIAVGFFVVEISSLSLMPSLLFVTWSG